MPRPWRSFRPAIAPLLLGVMVVGFLALRGYALLPHPADEGIYFYGALRMGQGLMPYRDFFHAHPPLHLLPTALLLKLFGFSLPLAKIPTFLAAAFTGVAVYLVTVAEAPASAKGLRQAVGLAAAAALLFTESLLKASATDTGICQATGWLALAAVLITRRRPRAAGLAAAAAPLTLLQAAPAAAVVLASALFFGRRFALRTLGMAAGAFVGVHIVFAALAGRSFWQQVYGFHLQKVGVPGEGWAQLGFVVYDNWTLFGLAACGLTALGASPGRGRWLAVLGVSAAGLTLAAMATRPRVFPFYFQPAFLPLALLAGWGLCRFGATIHRAWQDRRASWHETWLPLVVGALVFGPGRGPLSAWVSPRRAAQLETYAQTYEWQDAPGLGPLNAVVKVLFWQGGVRRAGHDASAVTQYLWQRSRWLRGQPQLVRALAAQAESHPGTSLLGDSTVAPLVALQAGVPITGDLVDTNMQRLRSGNLDVDAILALLESQPRALLLLGSSGGLGTLPQLRAYAARHFVPLLEVRHTQGAAYTLWTRR